VVSLFELGLFLTWLITTMAACFFGFNFIVIAWINLKKKIRVDRGEVAEWPMVSIHIPVYNDAKVITGTIDACLDLDYPKEKLEIIIIDDSTDQTTNIVRQYERPSSPRIKVIHRESREGYKAGALNRAMEASRGEFFLVLDADTVPKKNFLTEAIPHFYTNDRIAFVQGKLSAMNKGTSWLTQSFSLIYDWYRIHIQSALHKGGLFTCSVGSAVVYRKAAIEDVGSWTSDTVAEDLDMSYKLNINGWKGAFVPDAVCQDEAPLFYSSFVNQYTRHLKGPLQNLKKFGKSIITCRNATLSQKIEALVILSNPLTLPLGLLSIALGIASYLILPLDFISTFWFSPLGSAFSAFCATSLLSIPISYFLILRKEGCPERFVYLAGVAVVLGDHLLIGTKAILDLLFRKKASFTKTEKFGISTKGLHGPLALKSYEGRRSVIALRLVAASALLISIFFLWEKGLLFYSLGFSFPAVAWVLSLFLY